MCLHCAPLPAGHVQFCAQLPHLLHLNEIYSVCVAFHGSIYTPFNQGAGNLSLANILLCSTLPTYLSLNIWYPNFLCFNMSYVNAGRPFKSLHHRFDSSIIACLK